MEDDRINSLIEDQDKFAKYRRRNEIEAMALLREKRIDDLYNPMINNSVTDSLMTVYPNLEASSLYAQSNYPTVSDVINQERRLTWDEYFMNVAILTAKRSKDENTKVGACLVDACNRIIGCGYNGFIKGVDNSVFPSTRDGEWLDTKYPFVVHAELNAILNTTVFDLSNSKLFCTLFPCNDCAKVIIQKGISEVIYLSDKHHDLPEYVASRKLFEAANIITRQYDGEILL